MDDKELLRLPAKGAGYDVVWNDNWNCFQHKIPTLDKHGHFRHAWVPLEDDGDALRLASSMCMTVITGPCEARADTISGALRGQFLYEETIRQDQDSAVRRVIVRAAAEVGANK